MHTKQQFGRRKRLYLGATRYYGKWPTTVYTRPGDGWRLPLAI